MQTLRNFLIAFAAGFVMFGLCALMLARMLGLFGSGDTRPAADMVVSEQTDTAAPTEAPAERSANSFTVLIGGYADSGELDMLLLIKGDRVSERYMISAIPTALRVRVGDDGGQPVLTSLRELPTRFEGALCKEKILQTVTQITGLDVNYYLFLDREAALKLFDLTGGLYFDVPQTMTDVGTGTPASPEVFIDAGGQVLGKTRIVQLMTYDAYGFDETGNSVMRAKVQADFVNQAILQLGKLERSTRNRIAAMILPNCDTDFTYDDYEYYYDLIDLYTEYSVRNKIVYWEASDPIEEAVSTAMFESFR